jgi:glutamate-1-semialdehyde 2,1-aminomutase
LIKENPGQIAAIIIEPVPGNMGLVLPNPGYLENLRTICNREDILLIFDEVMTGFRLAPGGAQELLGVTPDMTTLGKIIGGGMPVGAYGGKKEIMDFVSPSGPVYQAGTLSGNPVAMSAGIAMLKAIQDDKEVFKRMEQKTRRIAEGITEIANRKKLPLHITQLGSMICVFFTEKNVYDFTTAKACNLEKFAKYFNGMLDNGIYLPPSQFESWFLSDALTDADVERIIEVTDKVL